MPLYAALFDSNLTSPIHTMSLSSRISNIQLSWALHGGIVSIQLRWAGGSVEAYDFYQRYDGYRVIIYDQFCDMPVADGFITDISIGATGANILCNGFWWRHYDQLYNFDTTAQDSNQGALVYNPVANSFQDDGQDFSDWESGVSPALYELEVTNDDNTISWGYPGAAFTTDNANDSIYVYQDYELSSAGWNGETPTDKTASSYTVMLCYDYWTSSEVVIDALTEVPSMGSDQTNIDETNTVIGPWEPPGEEGGAYPGEIIEKMASLSDSANAQWGYWCKNVAFDGTTPQKPIPYFEAQLNDGTFDWDIRKWMLKSGGDLATRNIQELRNHVRVIYRDMDDEGTLKLTSVGSDSTSIADYWQREAIVSAGDSYVDIAELYRALYLDKYKGALLGKPIALTSPYILDSSGSRWPLWFPIKHSKSYFKLTDVFPDAAIIDESWNRKTAGQAVQMEYSSKSNELRVFLDTESNELDALVARMDAFR